MNIPVTVYAESTPNPAAMKFVASIMLLPEGTVEYHHPGEAKDSPLASGLFAFSGVKSVFITANFITVTKEQDMDWFDMTQIIREYIRGCLMSGDPVFLKPVPEKSFVRNGESGTERKSSGMPSGDIESRIMLMLDEYVRPAVEQDGGAIHFRSFDQGVVTVTLKGSCSGCPSSTVTLKAGIENLLKSMLPEVISVVAEAE
jgi:Fe-S cluster biogenesis protein NfuA